MGSCNIDHTLQDVKNKLNDQKSFLPEILYKKGQILLEESPSQNTLNEFFHLLKKYDLATNAEQKERNEKLSALFSK